MYANKTALLGLLVVAAAISQVSATAAPYESDDYGFPVEPAASARSRARQTRGYWGNYRAARRISNACDYSKDVYRYARDADKVAPAVAKAESEELGRNVAQAQQEIEIVRQEAQQAPETVAALKSIGEHLTAAAKHYEMLHRECCKDSIDGTVCMTGCNQILLELDQAKAEHAALLRSMEIQVQSIE